MEIFNFGTEVGFNSNNNFGTITGVCIRDKNVTYEISYFNEGKVCSDWFYEHQFCTLESVTKSKIGFKNKNDERDKEYELFTATAIVK